MSEYTDLRTLPDGTSFRVIYGDWTGTVFSKNGKKYMHIDGLDEDREITGDEKLCVKSFIRTKRSEINKLDTYKAALRVACELLNDDVVYGIDFDKLFFKILDTKGGVCSLDFEKFILENLDRFSDDDKKREEAIKRLGW